MQLAVESCTTWRNVFRACSCLGMIVVIPMLGTVLLPIQVIHTESLYSAPW